MPLPTIEVEEIDGVVGITIQNDDMEEQLFIPMDDVTSVASTLLSIYSASKKQ